MSFTTRNLSCCNKYVITTNNIVVIKKIHEKNILPSIRLNNISNHLTDAVKIMNKRKVQLKFNKMHALQIGLGKISNCQLEIKRNIAVLCTYLSNLLFINKKGSIENIFLSFTQGSSIALDLKSILNYNKVFNS
jgi:ribosomal protein L1